MFAEIMGAKSKLRALQSRGWFARVGEIALVLAALLWQLSDNHVACQQAMAPRLQSPANWHNLDLGAPAKGFQLDLDTPEQHQLDLLAAQLLANYDGARELDFGNYVGKNNDLLANKYLVQDSTDGLRDKIFKLLGQVFSDEQQLGQLQGALLERSQRQQQASDLSGSKAFAAIDDINLHLPADDPLGGNGLYSRPVNDPAEFEASMSHLTNKLNRELPNSQNRTEWLSNYLINYYLTELEGADEGGNGVSLARGPSSANGKMLDALIQQYIKTRAAGGALDTDMTEQDKSASSGATDDTDGDYQLPTTTTGTADLAASRYGSGSEYIDHPLALVGHQYVQGGAGEGRQLLGPDGTFENVQVIKSDHAVPSYCDPPNPCPIGYTAEDGCLERFVNSASFSREYQAKQQCSCDNEHSLFNCASGPPSSAAAKESKHVEASDNTRTSSPRDNDGDGDSNVGAASSVATIDGARLDTLARTIQNRFGDLATIRNLISNHQNEQSSQAKDAPSSSYLVRSTRKWHQPIGDK